MTLEQALDVVSVESKHLHNQHGAGAWRKRLDNDAHDRTRAARSRRVWLTRCRNVAFSRRVVKKSLSCSEWIRRQSEMRAPQAMPPTVATARVPSNAAQTGQIEQLRFEPSSLSLKVGETATVGVVVDDVDDLLFNSVPDAVQPEGERQEFAAAADSTSYRRSQCESETVSCVLFDTFLPQSFHVPEDWPCAMPLAVAAWQFD